MASIIKELGMDVSDDQLSTLMVEADPDGSGQIDFGEFVIALQKQMSGGGKGGALADVVTKGADAWGFLNPFTWFEPDNTPPPPPLPPPWARSPTQPLSPPTAAKKPSPPPPSKPSPPPAPPPKPPSQPAMPRPPADFSKQVKERLAAVEQEQKVMKTTGKPPPPPRPPPSAAPAAKQAPATATKPPPPPGPSPSQLKASASPSPPKQPTTKSPAKPAGTAPGPQDSKRSSSSTSTPMISWRLPGAPAPTRKSSPTKQALSQIAEGSEEVFTAPSGSFGLAASTRKGKLKQPPLPVGDKSGSEAVSRQQAAASANKDRKILEATILNDGVVPNGAHRSPPTRPLSPPLPGTTPGGVIPMAPVPGTGAMKWKSAVSEFDTAEARLARSWQAAARSSPGSESSVPAAAAFSAEVKSRQQQQQARLAMAQATLGTTYSSEETPPASSQRRNMSRAPSGAPPTNQAIDDVLRDYNGPTLESLRRALKSGRDRPLTTPRMYSWNNGGGSNRGGSGLSTIVEERAGYGRATFDQKYGSPPGPGGRARLKREDSFGDLDAQCMTATILIMAISFGALVMLTLFGVNLFLRAQDTDGNSCVHRIGPTVKP